MDDLFFLNEELANVETNQSFDPLPAGPYNVTIVGAENKDTKFGNGKFIKLTLEVADGRYQGRKLWENINYRNQNPVAEDIGKRTMKTVMAHCGIEVVRTADDFIGYTLPVQVTLKPRKDQPDVLENQIRISAPAGGERPVPRPAAPPQPTLPLPTPLVLALGCVSLRK